MFRTLWRYRELVLSLVKRDLKTRYKSSALGFFWSLCKPLFIMGILFLVFVAIVPLRFDAGYFIREDRNLTVSGLLTHVAPETVDTPIGRAADDEYRLTRKDLTVREKTAFGVHLCIGILLWYFFAGALSESTHSILSNGNIIKKIKVPAEVFPVATVLANLIHLILAFAILIPIMLALGFRLTWMALTFPLIIVLLTILTAGFAFALSAMNVFYRDVVSITEIALMAWFYVTPIFYPADMAYRQFGDQWRGLFRLFVANPMATICIAARRVLFVHGNFDRPEVGYDTFWKYLVLCVFLSLGIYAAGRFIFLKLSPRFADEV